MTGSRGLTASARALEKIRAAERWRLLIGDARTRLQELEPESVQVCVTSPPYWNLRDYGEPGQLGMEASPQAFAAALVEVFRLVRRALKPDGLLFLNLGDTYIAGRSGGVGESSKINGSKRNMEATRASKLKGPKHRRASGLKKKDLAGIPWRTAFALQDDGWWLRADNIWGKPAPVPEGAKDRTCRQHEYVFMLSKSARYFYDQQATAEPASTQTRVKLGPAGTRGSGNGNGPKAVRREERDRAGRAGTAMSGFVEMRNLRSMWTFEEADTVWWIPSERFGGDHFATFPQSLPRKCILAGSRPGDLVLDPFAGVGTTGLVAAELGRRFVGVEISPRYAKVARGRYLEAQAARGQIGAAEADEMPGPVQLGMCLE